MLDSIGSMGLLFITTIEGFMTIYIYIYIYNFCGFFFPFQMKGSLQQWTFQLVNNNKVMGCNQFFFFVFFFFLGENFRNFVNILKMSIWKKRENFFGDF